MKNLKTKIKITVILCTLFLLGNVQANNAKTQAAAAAKEPAKLFRAGAATSNITPPLGEVIIGGWGSPPATHIHDDLHARCIVLDDGTTKLVFIVADLLGVDQDVTEAAKRIIEQETGIPTANVIISAIHTHSATSAMRIGNKRRQWHYNEPFDDYQNFVIRRFADAVRSAVNNLEPARIGWGVGSVPEHVFVRRWRMKEPVLNPFGGYDKVKMNPGRGTNLLEPAAEPDPQVSFISVQATDGRPIALLANYGLHYVGGVPKGHISADYFALFADRMQELLKADRQDPPFVGIMSNGTSGDVNNVNFGGKPERNAPYEKMRRVADDVAREVFRVHNKIEFQDWVPLSAMSEELALTVRKPDQEMIKRAEAILKQPDSVKLAHPLEKTYAERILYLVDWPDQINVVIQAFRIGDLGVAASPFETFSATGMEIKAKSPFKTNFVIGLANGYNGYLPTPEQHELGGYESWLSTNKVQKDTTIKMVAVFLRQFASMKQ